MTLECKSVFDTRRLGLAALSEQRLLLDFALEKRRQRSQQVVPPTSSNFWNPQVQSSCLLSKPINRARVCCSYIRHEPE
ncbi:hypothetical protein [Nostoc sp. PA-18-2419]|uniref:hypothetical protein n=1 Tax=Nostoc sp. PA-18-2419 TaxID=2575443 RepID=UPI001107C765|nr:hypothetical protein [Nostoc sp. PA-18-2419]